MWSQSVCPAIKSWTENLGGHDAAGEARPQEQEASSALEGGGRPRVEVTLLSTWERDSNCSGKTGCKEEALAVTGLPRWHSRNPNRRRKRLPILIPGSGRSLE